MDIGSMLPIAYGLLLGVGGTLWARHVHKRAHDEFEVLFALSTLQDWAVPEVIFLIAWMNRAMAKIEHYSGSEIDKEWLTKSMMSVRPDLQTVVAAIKRLEQRQTIESRKSEAPTNFEFEWRYIKRPPPRKRKIQFALPKFDLGGPQPVTA